MSSSLMERDGAFAAAVVGLLLLLHFALAHPATGPSREIALRLGICFVVCAICGGAGRVGVRELLRLGRRQVARTLQVVVLVMLLPAMFLAKGHDMLVLLVAAFVLFAALPLALYFHRVDRGSARAR